MGFERKKEGELGFWFRGWSMNRALMVYERRENEDSECGGEMGGLLLSRVFVCIEILPCPPATFYVFLGVPIELS